MNKIRIGTRGGTLGLWYGVYTKASLEEKGLEAELVIFPDRFGHELVDQLDNTEADAYFTGTMAEALRRGDIDMAVHAMDELPTTPPEGIVIAGVSYRDDPSDWLLIREAAVAQSQLFKLKNGALVGSSTPRRTVQLVGYRPDIGFGEITGDLPTRLDLLRIGVFDALLVAGVDLARLRLELEGLEMVKLNMREFVPAPAQGVLAYHCCADDLETRRTLQRIHEPKIATVTNIERKVLRLLGGDPLLPLGIYCEMDTSGNYHVWAVLADAWDKPVRRVRLSQSTHLGLAEKVVAGLGGTVTPL